MSHAPVWKFFVKTTGDIQCKLCAQVYEKAKDGSTGNLLYHLQQHHKIEAEQDDVVHRYAAYADARCAAVAPSRFRRLWSGLRAICVQP